MANSPCGSARPGAARRRLMMVVTLCARLSAPSPSLASADPTDAAIGDLTLEQLLDVQITSVSKKAEALLSAASAIYVITAEDIRRSGATSIPEALRLAPGVQVARINGSRWAISARGFNGEFANKLLVLMDGRTVYDPAFSGVYWDVQDTMLEDIDRIEVIRGPGATLWGANAVNGVINITTKRPGETQGLLVTGGGGNQETGFGAIRYGGSLGARFRYRLYAKYFNRATQAAALGVPADDDWNVGRGGFRFEWQPVPTSIVTLQGDFYQGGEDATFPERGLTPPLPPLNVRRVDVEGRNVLARWHYVLGERSEATLQAYYDHTARRDENDEDTDTIDVTLEHHVGLWSHDVVWGVGYRWVSDAFDGVYGAPVDPPAAALQYLQWVRAGSDAARRGPPPPDRRHQARAQRVQRLRGSAERVSGLDPTPAPRRVACRRTRRAHAVALEPGPSFPTLELPDRGRNDQPGRGRRRSRRQVGEADLL